MKKWFYVDVVTTVHERVAVKAEDEEDAKDCVRWHVDAGDFDFADAGDRAYGSVTDEITVGDPEHKRPPKAMRKFDGLRGEVK